jgi:hypothetical protein
MDYLIVRRGLAPSYYQFLKVFAAERQLQVIVDRRTAERRSARQPVGAERRRQNRRGAPPSTWYAGDFVVVKGGEREPR